MRLLAIEDNPADRRLVELFLGDSISPVFHVDHAVSLAAGASRIETGSYELVLLDLSLADSQGVETVQRYRDIQGAPPFLVFTGLDDERVGIASLSLGAEEYVVKDRMDPEGLRSNILHALERVRLRRGLEQSQERLETIVMATSDALLVVGADRVVRFANPSALALFGRGEGSLVGQPTEIPCDDEGPTEITITTPSSEERVAEARCTPIRWDNQDAELLSLRDITARKRYEVQLQQLTRRLEAANARLQRMAATDPLTSLANRWGLEHDLPAVQVESSHTEVLLVVCDGLQALNREHGRSMGDLAIRHVASIIERTVRPGDVVSRVGGDEFVVLLPSTPAAGARSLAERLRLAVAAAPVALVPEPLQVTVSICVVALPELVTTVEELLTLTREPMRAGLADGVNQVWSPHRHIRPDSSELELRALIEHSASSGFPNVMVQPIVELPSGRVVANELLVRGPPGPLHSPTALLTLARETGLNTAFDLCCIRACARAMEAHPRLGTVHLNVLPSTLLDVQPEALLAEFQARDRLRVCFELSERQFIPDPSLLHDRIGQLKRAGIRIAIDDVGAVPGSLENLVTMEPHLLKLDIALVRGVADDRSKQRVLERTVRLAHALSTPVVAEGVERIEDLEVLLQLDIQFGQGLYWGGPRPIETPDPPRV